MYTGNLWTNRDLDISDVMAELVHLPNSHPWFEGIDPFKPIMVPFLGKCWATELGCVVQVLPVSISEILR